MLLEPCRGVHYSVWLTVFGGVGCKIVRQKQGCEEGEGERVTWAKKNCSTRRGGCTQAPSTRFPT